MKTTVKTIIFDFGGVLIDWDPRNLYRSYFPEEPQALEDFLNEVDFYTWNAAQDKGRSFADGVAELSAKFPHRAHLIEVYAKNWKESITGEIKGTVEILHTLKAKNYPLYGLSNWSAETFPLIEDEYPFFELFDEIVLSGEVKLNKPEPEIYLMLLSKIEYAAEECLFIDDSQANVDAAKSLGFQAIPFETPEILERDLKEYGLL